MYRSGGLRDRRPARGRAHRGPLAPGLPRRVRDRHRARRDQPRTWRSTARRRSSSGSAGSRGSGGCSRRSASGSSHCTSVYRGARNRRTRRSDGRPTSSRSCKRCSPGFACLPGDLRPAGPRARAPVPALAAGRVHGPRVVRRLPLARRLARRSGSCGPTAPTSAISSRPDTSISRSTYPLILVLTVLSSLVTATAQLLPRGAAGAAAEGSRAALPGGAKAALRSAGRRVTTTAAAPLRAAQPAFDFPCFDGLRAIAVTSAILGHVGFVSGAEFGKRGEWYARARLPARDRAGDLLHDLRASCSTAPSAPPRSRADQRWLRRSSSDGVPCASFPRTGSRSPPSCSSTTRPRSRRSWAEGAAVSRASPRRQLLSLYSLTQIYSQHWFYAGMTQSWTLAVEISFYLMLPVYASLMRRLGAGRDPDSRLRLELAGAAALYLVSVGWRTLVFYGGVLPTIAQHWLPGYLDVFGLGMALAAVHAWSAQTGGRIAVLEWLGRHADVCFALAVGCFLVVALGLDLPRRVIEVSGGRALRTQLPRCTRRGVLPRAGRVRAAGRIALPPLPPVATGRVPRRRLVRRLPLAQQLSRAGAGMGGLPRVQRQLRHADHDHDGVDAGRRLGQLLPRRAADPEVEGPAPVPPRWTYRREHRRRRPGSAIPRRPSPASTACAPLPRSRWCCTTRRSRPPR